MSFSMFIENLSETNTALDFFVDFEKIKKNVSLIEIKLNSLNYLIGKDDLEKAINELWEENPKVFKVLNILIAVRKNINILDSEGNITKMFINFTTKEKVLQFFQETGLSDIFRNKNIKNIVDYVFGIEVGLDTNAHKNRKI